MQTEYHVWRDADGNPHPLQWLVTEDDVQVTFGMKGRFMPPVNLVYAETPSAPGGTLQQARYTVREIEIPVEVFGSDYNEVERVFRTICEWFDISGETEGTYEVIRSDLAHRHLRCIYKSGLEGTETREWALGFKAAAIIVLSAGDVYWFDPLERPAQTISVTGGAGGSSGTTYTNTATFVNAGSAPTWPIWTVTCPHSMTTQAGFIGTDAPTSYQTTVTITNVTTGDSFSVTYTDTIPANTSGSTNYPSSDTVRVIDTRTDIKTVANGSGTLVPSELLYDGLFPLLKGNNVIRVDIAVAADAPGLSGVVRLTEVHHISTSTVSMTYQTNHLTV